MTIAAQASHPPAQAKHQQASSAMTATSGPGLINHPPGVDRRLPSNEAAQQAAGAGEPRRSIRES
jgi:hypothetical protein